MVDQYCLYFTVLSCTFAALAYIYKIVRIYGKIEVNCWFCNGNSKVKYNLSNSFICPFCDQYNGFREDGDYNCIIPAQHSESYSYSVKQNFQTSSCKEKSKFDNGLCDGCNLNQALKIRALAEFSSFSSDDNNEIEKFRERLEEIYGLCQQCQAILHQTLGKQNSWLKPQLISWKLMMSREKVIKALVKTAKSTFWRKALHILCLLICSILSLLSFEKYSPDLLQPIKTTFELNFLKVDDTYTLLTYLGLISQSFLILLFSDKIITGSNLASYIGWCLLFTVEKCDPFFNGDNIRHIQCAVNIFNLFFVFWIAKVIFRNSTHIHQTKGRLKRAVKRDVNYYTSLTQDCDTPNMSPSTPHQDEHSTDETKKSAQKDLDADLLGLKISTPKKSSVGTFSPQNLFRDTASEKGSTVSRRNVVQPSKFGKHFITQASWVAGGYWGSPGSPQRGRLTSQNVSHLEMNQPSPVFSASRSSSQSSGFVSQMSECTSSKSQANTFQNGSKYSLSQPSSFAAEGDRGSVCSWNRTPVNHASSFSALGPQNFDSFEAQSACSASSFPSDNSQVGLRLVPQHGAYFRDSGPPPTPTSDVLSAHTTTPSLHNKSYVTSYFNMGVAFFLGLSVSANIFLVIILSHYDIALK